MLIPHAIWFHQSPAGISMSVFWRKPARQSRPPTSTFYLQDTLEALVRNAYSAPTPAGIWIDRLQECPEELAGATPEQVDAILKYLRKQHPNGV